MGPEAVRAGDGHGHLIGLVGTAELVDDASGQMLLTGEPPLSVETHIGGRGGQVDQAAEQNGFEAGVGHGGGVFFYDDGGPADGFDRRGLDFVRPGCGDVRRHRCGRGRPGLARSEAVRPKRTHKGDELR